MTTANEAVQNISETIDMIDENWLADDGGRTWTAVDAVDLGHSLISDIRKGDFRAAWECSDSLDGARMTGEEMSMVQEAYEWARPFIWNEWRKEAGANEEETPFTLVQRRMKEGMTMALYKIACPPDKTKEQWKEAITSARKA
jgi:hypothetical protein